jgi:hypothetical protein
VRRARDEKGLNIFDASPPTSIDLLLKTLMEEICLPKYKPLKREKSTKFNFFQ